MEEVADGDLIFEAGLVGSLGCVIVGQGSVAAGSSLLETIERVKHQIRLS